MKFLNIGLFVLFGMTCFLSADIKFLNQDFRITKTFEGNDFTVTVTPGGVSVQHVEHKKHKKRLFKKVVKFFGKTLPKLVVHELLNPVG